MGGTLKAVSSNHQYSKRKSHKHCTVVKSEQDKTLVCFVHFVNEQAHWVSMTSKNKISGDVGFIYTNIASFMMKIK